MNIGTTPAIATSALRYRAADSRRLNSLPPSISPLRASPAPFPRSFSSLGTPLRSPNLQLPPSLGVSLFVSLVSFCALLFFVFSIFQPLLQKRGGKYTH